MRTPHEKYLSFKYQHVYSNTVGAEKKNGPDQRLSSAHTGRHGRLLPQSKPDIEMANVATVLF